MRDDLQVDKGNGVGWGFARVEPGPILEKTGLEGRGLSQEQMQRILKRRTTDSHGEVLLSDTMIWG